MRAPLGARALTALVVGLGWTQFALFAIVDCEATVVNLSLLQCELLVPRPLVLHRLAQAPAWLLVVSVVLGHAVCAVLGLFFLAALVHWVRLQSTHTARLPPSRKRQPPTPVAARRPPYHPAAGDGTAGAPDKSQSMDAVMSPGQWTNVSPATGTLATPFSQLMTPSDGGCSEPITDQRGLDRYLSTTPHGLRLRTSGDGLPSAGGVGSPMPPGSSPALGSSPTLMAGADVWTSSGSGAGPGSSPWPGLSPDLKYQKAMYVPASGDRLDRARAHAQRAARLLALLRTEPGPLDVWRDNMRTWMASVILRPLARIGDETRRAIKEAAAKPAPPPAPVPATGVSLFGSMAARGPAPAPGPVVPPGTILSPSQWVLANPSHPLVKQLRKLERFYKCTLHRGASDGATPLYVEARIKELALGRCVASYVWNGGGRGQLGTGPGASQAGTHWEPSLPTDAELLVHVFATFMDMVLPPPPPGVDGRPAAPPAASTGGLGTGLSLFGGLSRAGTGSLFGGAGPALQAPSQQPPPQVPANAVFAVPAEEMVSFTHNHFIAAGAHVKNHARSSVAIVQRRSAPGSAADGKSGRAQAPHFDLVCMHTDWPVAVGEHNVWDCLVLLALAVEKTGATLSRARLDCELQTAFRSAVLAEPTRDLDLTDSTQYRCELPSPPAPGVDANAPWSPLLTCPRWCRPQEPPLRPPPVVRHAGESEACRGERRDQELLRSRSHRARLVRMASRHGRGLSSAEIRPWMGGRAGPRPPTAAVVSPRAGCGPEGCPRDRTGCTHACRRFPPATARPRGLRQGRGPFGRRKVVGGRLTCAHQATNG